MDSMGSFDSGRKSLQINVGAAVNALSLSRDNSKVVVAGRSLLKIYGIHETKGFHEHLNLQVGRKQGLNMSCSDVAWSPVDDNLIATSATNGTIIGWDLTTTQRDKKLGLFNEHRRTVTKISFHNTEPSKLLSGSQDGTMKMFDLRGNECTLTFQGRCDGIRSVHFNPHEYFLFAASFDSGDVQVWDYRRTNSYLCKFIAHKGSVYTLEWHPDPEKRFTLATGGRNNMVKIWNISNNKQKEVNSIPTISSVASLKWRPHRPEQLATVPMMLDFSINVWDLRRKYIPFAYFCEHRDQPTSIAWKRNDPNIIFSCAKNGTLMMHHMKDASRPADNCRTCGLSFSSCGAVAHANKVTNSTPRAQSPSGLSTKLPGIFGWMPVSGSREFGDADSPTFSSPAASMVSIEKMINFFDAKSNLVLSCGKPKESKACEDLDDCLEKGNTVVEHLFQKHFVFAAKHYILDGEAAALSFKDLCGYNADVALQAGSCNAARTWLLLGIFFGKDILLKSETEASGKSKVTLDTNDKVGKKPESDSKRHSICIKPDELPGSQIINRVASSVEPESENQSDEDRLMENYVTDIARGRHSEPDLYTNDDDNLYGFGHHEITSDPDLMSEQEFNFNVPVEAFEQREDLDNDAIANFGQIDAPSGMNTDTDTAKRVLTPHGGRWHEKVVPSRIDSSSSSSPVDAEMRADFMTDGLFNVMPTLWPAPLEAIKEEISCQQLKCFAELNDVQSAVSMLLAMSSYSTPWILPIETADAEQWQNSYLSLLAQHKLWVRHAQVIKLSRVPSIHALSSSSTIQTKCQICQRRMPPANSWSCDRRSDKEHANRPVTCFYCQLEVRGLYTYCQSCSFGGHSSCLKKWIKWCVANGRPTDCKHHRL